MLQYFFQFHFLFVLLIIIYVNYGISEEDRFTEWENRGQKCESLFKNCSCPHSAFWNVLNCQKMTDFSNFSQILESEILFDVNKRFRITFSDVKHLPAGILRGLYISHLILDGRDITVDEDLFQGIPHLEDFIVKESAIEDIPDFRIVNDSIWSIMIESSRLTFLRGKNLQNLTIVNFLSFSKNSMRFIDPDVFKGTENVDCIYLSDNLLTSIPPKLLDSMQKLRTIDISNNNLQHVGNLFSIARPRDIYLSFNNISDPESMLHFKIDFAASLHLSGNPIKNLSKNSFRGKIPKVKRLYLSRCRLQEFDEEPFLSLDHLEILDLRYNLIEDIREPVYAHKKLSVGNLNLGGNKLQSLGNKLRIKNIDIMFLHGNEINYLTDEDFKHVDPMKTLKLEENKIQRIDTNTFQPMKERLLLLDLSSNLIQKLNGSVKYLSNLEYLFLTNNSLQSFAKDEFMGLDNLVELHLQYNQIKSLGQLQDLPKLIHLFISHNDIESLRPDQIPKTVKELQLAGNPWKCDCHLQAFAFWFMESFDHKSDICLNNDNKSSLYEKSKCPPMCLCGCTENEEVSYISVDCSSKKLSALPEFLKNNPMKMEDNLTASSNYGRPYVVDQNIHPLLHFEDLVLEINLENNNLESLEEIELHPNLIQLLLANNKLRRLPEFIFDNLKNLKEVSLSGNPWECDCSTIKFKKWLNSNYAIIKDINDIRCGPSDRGETNLSGKVLWTLTDLDFCPLNIGLIVSVTIGILTFVTICLTAKILYSKYKLNFRVFLYFHGFTSVKEKDPDYDKTFDAFLSFSNEDGEFVVNEIIREIEKKAPNVRLCIHYRDFKAGEFIPNNILFAVENSKKTVLFLSKNFLESHWCIVEFQAAYVQALKDKAHQIIVIKLGDLPKNIDPQIQAYLDSTTYLTWGEKYFWKKLLYILPTSSCARNRVSRRPENNEIL